MIYEIEVFSFWLLLVVIIATLAIMLFVFWRRENDKIEKEEDIYAEAEINAIESSILIS